MKKVTILFVAFLTLAAFTDSYAQTAEEIVSTYIENIGGQEEWSKVNSMKATGVGRQQGVDYPFTFTTLKDGKTLINVDLQGQQFTVEAFDGDTQWAMNFQTQKPEASDSETSLNYKNGAKDNMPDAFMNYKEKGYEVELLGEEDFDGTSCYKIKLTKTPMLIDGVEEENIETYYFDKDNFVPIAMEAIVMSGPGKGSKSTTLFTDYQEKNGLYMPYSVITQFNGQNVFEMLMKDVEFNVDVDESIFEMPEETAGSGEEKK